MRRSPLVAGRANDNAREGDYDVPGTPIDGGMMFALWIVGVVVIIALGVPLVERLLRRLRPLTPEQEEAHRFLEQARRRLDRIPR